MDTLENIESIKADNHKGILLNRPGIFTPAELMKDFKAEFLDENYCRQWVLTRLHPGSPVCPGCQAIIEGVALQRFWEGKRIKCRECDKFFTARTGTFLDGCHMDFRAVILLAVFLSFGIHPGTIAKFLNCSSETVRNWEKKYKANEVLHEYCQS
jgi:transposase-like protein